MGKEWKMTDPICRGRGRGRKRKSENIWRTVKGKRKSDI